jgi:hypothetical protein
VAGEGTVGGNAAIAVAVYAELVYTVISASCSSPQTAEINADKRADTLMKWVYVGLAQGAAFGLLGAWLAKQSGYSPWPPLGGAALAMVLLYGQYRHALASGLRNGGPSTET